jgi:hypothetical protein
MKSNTGKMSNPQQALTATDFQSIPSALQPVYAISKSEKYEKTIKNPVPKISLPLSPDPRRKLGAAIGHLGPPAQGLEQLFMATRGVIT